MKRLLMTAMCVVAFATSAFATTIPVPFIANSVVLGGLIPGDLLTPPMPMAGWKMATEPVVYSMEEPAIYAQAAPAVTTTPENPPVVVVTVPEDTTVDIDASWFAKEWFPIFGALIVSIISYAFKFLPGYLQTAYKVFRVDQALKRSIDMGIARVVGATKDKKWSINVGNAVIAAALENFLASMPAKLTEWAGGKDGLVRKILARVSEWLPAEFGDIKPAGVAEDSAKPRTSMETNIPPVKSTTNFSSQFNVEAKAEAKA